MITAVEEAGFIAAHAIWCVSDADGLIPIFAFTTDDGKRQLERLAHDDAAAAVELGRKQLEEGVPGAVDAVLAYDGRITLETGKVDAILLEIRSYAFPSARATIAIPYTPYSSGHFKVHKPKLLQWQECEDFDMGEALDAFFRGVAAHEKGAEVWNAALDESR